MGPYNIMLLRNGYVDGYGGIFGSNDLIVEDITMNDARNDSDFTCMVVSQNDETILGSSDLTTLYIAGEYVCTYVADILKGS